MRATLASIRAERAGRFVVHSEVRIDMGDDVRVDAFGLQGRIVGGVGTTVHTGETPIGRGELQRRRRPL